MLCMASTTNAHHRAAPTTHRPPVVLLSVVPPFAVKVVGEPRPPHGDEEGKHDEPRVVIGNVAKVPHVDDRGNAPDLVHDGAAAEVGVEGRESLSADPCQRVALPCAPGRDGAKRHLPAT